MAKYIVQGEAYYGPNSHLYPVGSEVTLPDSGRHSVPPPGWLNEDGEPVSHEEHKALTDALNEQLKAEAKKAADEKLAARKAKSAPKAG
ncbi:MAG: hypothetical protein JST54_12535 [Deltaproteobacteria bacterium]|nr:hypothetical protein [Deltaproteobacteria bacterium]